jgi:hypothetical protein
LLASSTKEKEAQVIKAENPTEVQKVKRVVDRRRTN